MCTDCTKQFRLRKVAYRGSEFICPVCRNTSETLIPYNDLNDIKMSPQFKKEDSYDEVYNSPYYSGTKKMLDLVPGQVPGQVSGSGNIFFVF